MILDFTAGLVRNGNCFSMDAINVSFLPLFALLCLQEAVSWLASQSFVSPGGIGAHGKSFGGALCLEMAARLSGQVGLY